MAVSVYSVGVALVLSSLVLAVVPAGYLPWQGTWTLQVDGSSSVACPVVQPASGNTGPTVECYLNGTAQLSWEPNTLTAPVGATVIFSVGIVGSLPHDFALDAVVNDSTLRTWTANPKSVSTSELNAYFANHTAVNLPVNSSSSRSVSSPIHLSTSQGVYYFVCLVPYHFQSGMWGTLTLQPTASGGGPGSGNSSSNNDIPYIAIGVVFVAAVGVAIVLTMRRRSPPRSPDPAPSPQMSQR